MHVRYKSSYIVYNNLYLKMVTPITIKVFSLVALLPSSAKKEREMTNFCELGRLIFTFGIVRCHCIFRLRTFLEPLAYRKDLDHCEFR